MLQAALHIETGLGQHLTDSSSVTASTVKNQTHARPTNVEQLFHGHDSVAVSKTFDARVQCTDNVMPISATDTMKVGVDPAAAFCLSQDDFDDDIDDLSFIDLPLHSELSHCSKSSALTSNCVSAAAASEKKSPSVITNAISISHRLQAPNNCLTNDVIDVMSAQNENKSFAARVNLAHQNGIHASGYFCICI